MADRNPARMAAPLALLAALIAVVVVIEISGSSSRSSHGTPLPTTTPTAATHPARHASATPKVYVVKAGDTLTVIADKTGVSLDELQQLNPEVDANALQTGQRLKLLP